MSGKESRVGGDPVEGIGSLAREPDNQEREEMLEVPNFEATGCSDIQPTSDC